LKFQIVTLTDPTEIRQIVPSELSDNLPLVNILVPLGMVLIEKVLNLL